MKLSLKNPLQAKACSLVATTIALATIAASNAAAADVRVLNDRVSGVPLANTEAIFPNIFSPEFTFGLVVEGSDPLENPSGVITKFGNLSTGDRTEPDENTYLVLDHNPGGPGPTGFDYGRHFLFQGHEMLNGNTNQAYLTRVNLDVVDPAHRITLLTPLNAMGFTGFNSIDGSTWNPFSETLLFTQEDGNIGGVIEVGADFDTTTGAGKGLRTLYDSLGRGGYEGIHPDDWGNILIIEDAGGTTIPAGTIPGQFGRNPNSFVYRFVPTDPTDLSQGKLQALRVSINNNPVTFVPVDAAHPTGDVLSNNQLLLHTVGASWPVQWITIRDTANPPPAGWPDANAVAKAAGATPFKRPENAQFQPGSKFQTFFFIITGDTDFRAGNQPALAARGSYGGIFRVDLDGSRETGRISLVVLGDADHAAFDNVTFVDDKDTILVAEDRGDTLHDQLNRLDSVWAYKLLNGNPAGTTVSRFIALGEDPLAPFNPGVEDNEPTGVHMSEGDSTINGLIGTKVFNRDRARLFFTQQHGENNLFEVLPLD